MKHIYFILFRKKLQAHFCKIDKTNENLQNIYNISCGLPFAERQPFRFPFFNRVFQHFYFFG